MAWIKGASLDELIVKPAVVNIPPKQIAVFNVGGKAYAVDNRCPHEGYPLAAGHVSNEDCLLTCNWHNWKFRLDTGECVIGGDHVQSYATKIEDGHVWVDITDPPAAESRRRILNGLKGAFADRDFGRICREIARLHYHGLSPAESVASALEWSHNRLEFGTTHAVAGAADWLRLAGAHREEFEIQLICLSEAVDHLAFDSLRHPLYRYAEPAAEQFDAGAFLSAVEAEDAIRAEAIVARGLADGLHWDDLEEPFAAAAFAHYSDFGHSVIYVSKARELIDQLVRDIEPFVMLPLTRHLCYTTREDLLPEFRDYAPLLAALRQSETRRFSEELTVPFPAGLRGAFEWLRAGMETRDVQQIYDRLLEALALNFLHCDSSYDVAYDRPVSQNIGWLDFTHGITMANAARKLCSQYPQFWKPALAQLACFLGRNSGFIDSGIERESWFVEDPGSFFHDVHQRLLDHGFRDPIFSVHLLKTALAVEEEYQACSASCRQALLAALNRFLNSPIKEKHVRRLARQSITLVSRNFV